MHATARRGKGGDGGGVDGYQVEYMSTLTYTFPATLLLSWLVEGIEAGAEQSWEGGQTRLTTHGVGLGKEK